MCGTYVDQYPNRISGITFKSGRRVFFDGPKDLFRYYLNLSKYEKDAAREDVVSIVVTDYYSFAVQSADGKLEVNVDQEYYVCNCKGCDCYTISGKEGK